MRRRKKETKAPECRCDCEKCSRTLEGEDLHHVMCELSGEREMVREPHK